MRSRWHSRDHCLVNGFAPVGASSGQRVSGEGCVGAWAKNFSSRGRRVAGRSPCSHGYLEL